MVSVCNPNRICEKVTEASRKLTELINWPISVISDSTNQASADEKTKQPYTVHKRKAKTTPPAKHTKATTPTLEYAAFTPASKRLRGEPAALSATVKLSFDSSPPPNCHDPSSPI